MEFRLVIQEGTNSNRYVMNISVYSTTTPSKDVNNNTSFVIRLVILSIHATTQLTIGQVTSKHF